MDQFQSIVDVSLGSIEIVKEEEWEEKKNARRKKSTIKRGALVMAVGYSDGVAVVCKRGEQKKKLFRSESTRQRLSLNLASLFSPYKGPKCFLMTARNIAEIYIYILLCSSVLMESRDHTLFYYLITSSGICPPSRANLILLGIKSIYYYQLFMPLNHV